MNKLLLIDGLNIVRRCYEANPAPDSSDKAQSAASVALQSMRRGLRDHNPTHCVVVFDSGGPTWRHALWSEYKANRKPMCPFLADEVARMKERMALQEWPIMAIPGEEADDTLFALGSAACAEGEEVVLLSTDKDLVRLVALGVKVYNHFDREWRDAAWCERRFGVPPEKLTDFLALMGDSVDNIPGVDGIGAKTAAKLLLEYGHLAAILDAAEQGLIKGRQGENLVAQRSQAELSLALASFKSRFSILDLWWEELEAPKA